MFYILTYFTLSPLTPGTRVTMSGVRRSWHLDLIAFKNVDEIVPNNKNKYIFYLEFRKCLFAFCPEGMNWFVEPWSHRHQKHRQKGYRADRRIFLSSLPPVVPLGADHCSLGGVSSGTSWPPRRSWL